LIIFYPKYLRNALVLAILKLKYYKVFSI